MPWTVVCKIQSSDWTISLPIGMMDPTDWPVVWLSTMMVSFGVDRQLEQWNSTTTMDHHHHHHGTSGGKSAKSFVYNNVATTLSADLPYAEMIDRVATKKKQMEASHPGGGLVFLRATVIVEENENDGNGKNNSNNNNQDVTNVLQFWVVQSRLSLPVQERQWWWRRRQQQQRTTTVEGTSKQSTMWSRLWCRLTAGKRALSPPKQQMEADTGVLTVRYRHGARVYEIVFQEDELVLLPNDRAKELGSASSVA
jgi:hypothetical protein